MAPTRPQEEFNRACRDHCNPNLHYVNKETNYQLGRIINLVRHRNDFNIKTDPERRKLWEEELGLTFSPADEAWENTKNAIETHLETNKTLPSVRTELGKKLNDIKQRGDFIKHKPKRMQYLREKGFKLHINPAENKRRFEEYDLNGTLNKWDIRSKKQVSAIIKRRKIDPLYAQGKLWKSKCLTAS